MVLFERNTNYFIPGGEGGGERGGGIKCSVRYLDEALKYIEQRLRALKASMEQITAHSQMFISFSPTTGNYI